MENQIALFNIGAALGTPWGQIYGVNDLVSLIITGSMTMAGIIALFMFVWGGFQFMQHAGGNNPQAVQKAKFEVTLGVVGFVIVISAYWVIRFIETMTNSTFITNPFR
jgi:hypothetical protein